MPFDQHNISLSNDAQNTYGVFKMKHTFTVAILALLAIAGSIETANAENIYAPHSNGNTRNIYADPFSGFRPSGRFEMRTPSGQTYRGRTWGR